MEVGQTQSFLHSPAGPQGPRPEEEKGAQEPDVWERRPAGGRLARQEQLRQSHGGRGVCSVWLCPLPPSGSEVGASSSPECGEVSGRLLHLVPRPPASLLPPPGPSAVLLCNYSCQWWPH